MLFVVLLWPGVKKVDRPTPKKGITKTGSDLPVWDNSLLKSARQSDAHTHVGRPEPTKGIAWTVEP